MKQLTNKNFLEFAQNIASDYGRLDIKPEEYSPSAMGRLREYMNDYIIQVKGIQPQFRARNRVELINFDCQADREYYEKAFERYLKEKAKIEAQIGIMGSKFLILVEMMKFAQAAEFTRMPHIARRMYNAVNNKDFPRVACCANKFKGSITRAVQVLINDFNVKRDDISLIWGGGQQLTKKQKQKKTITSNEMLMQMLKESDIDMEDLDLDDIDIPSEEELKFPPELRLGIQSKQDRQREIDRFQKGITHYCFYTFRAGGVGLSLHHTDKLTIQKVRHKESGYAYEEDIPLIPTRPRINFVAPTYSAIDLVQALGRCPRITSLSDTEQILIYYRGTIEERIAAIVNAKLKSVKNFNRNRESWEDVITGGKYGESDSEIDRKHLTDSNVDDSEEEIEEDE